MKRYKPFHFCFLMFLLLLAACTTVEETQQEKTDLVVPPTEITSVEKEPIEPWQIVKQLDLEFEPTYVAFLNEDIGISDRGREDDGPSYTEDGGESWRQLEDQDYCSTTIEIVNPETAFMCHGDMGFRMSANGGKNFVYLTQPVGGNCSLISFLDEEMGWGVSGKTLSVTKDGANSWTAIPLPEGVDRIAAISLRTPEAGYVLDTSKTLYQTEDGGSTWVSQTLKMGSDELEIMSFGRPSAAIRFSDEKNGLVVLNLAGEGESEVVALQTIDGGETWERYILPVEIGPLYLSHDGQYLTVMDMNTRDKAIMFKR